MRVQLSQSMASHKRAKRKPSNRQCTSGRHLLDHAQKVERFARASIMRTGGTAHAAEIKTHHCPPALHKGARQGLHHFVVHRATKQRVRMRHDGHTARHTFGLVTQSFDGARFALQCDF